LRSLDLRRRERPAAGPLGREEARSKAESKLHWNLATSTATKKASSRFHAQEGAESERRKKRSWSPKEEENCRVGI